MPEPAPTRPYSCTFPHHNPQLGQWNAASVHESQCSNTHPRYCCMNYKSSITGQNSYRKLWNLLPHSKAFILLAPSITDLGDASMLHRNKYTLFIHYFYCELETDFSFEIVWKGPNMRQQKASGSLQSHFFVSCQGVQQPPTIHSLTLPL